MHASVRVGWSLVALLGLMAAASAQSAPALMGTPTLLDDALEGDFALAGDLALSPGDHVQLVLNSQDDASCYLLDITAPQACFHRLAGAVTRPLGASGALPAAPDGAAHPFAVLRKNFRLTFLWSGQVVCRGWDGTLANGKAGYVAPEGKVVDPFVQPLAPIQATDSFMREQDAQHMWTPLTGAWEIQSLRDDDQADEMEADKSANAFSYQCAGQEGTSIAVAEKDLWFWADYRLEASVRSLGSGAIGLLLLAQDESNYLAFRWASAWDQGPRGNRAELLEVVGGEAKVLAQKPGGFAPDQWYKLSAAICDGHVECAIDGALLLEADAGRFGAGNPGLYAEGADRAFFDDVLIEDYETFREDFSTLTRWETAAGEWSLSGAGEARCTGDGLLTSGRPAWANYEVEATVAPGKGRAGLELARQADGHAALFRLDGGKAQLLATGPEGETLIAERSLKTNGGKPLRLAASVEQGFVKTYVDGEAAVEGLVPNCLTGGIGLQAQGAKEARFSNVRVAFLKPKQPAQVTREFAKVSDHPEMAEWAGNRAPWVQPAEMAPGATWWTKGDYFGDATLSFKVRFVGLRDGTVKVSLNGEPEKPDQGVHLVLTATKGSKILRAQVLDGTREIGQGEVELSGSSCSVRFARQGAHILVSVDDKPLIAQQLAASAPDAQG